MTVSSVVQTNLLSRLRCIRPFVSLRLVRSRRLPRTTCRCETRPSGLSWAALQSSTQAGGSLSREPIASMTTTQPAPTLKRAVTISNQSWFNMMMAMAARVRSRTNHNTRPRLTTSTRTIRMGSLRSLSALARRACSRRTQQPDSSQLCTLIGTSAARFSTARTPSVSSTMIQRAAKTSTLTITTRH